MRSLTIHIQSTRVPIVIGRNAVSTLPTVLSDLRPSKIVLLSDETVYRLYAETVASVLPQPLRTIVVPPGEASKSLDRASMIYDALADAQVERDAVILALGGGVVGDLAGFVAATWHRGIRFLQIPTTTESAIDAAVGGKTAVNHHAGKNLIGVFHQPSAIIIDTQFLSSLNNRDYLAGIAESVKHAASMDPAFLDWHEENAPLLLARDAAALEEFIERNCLIKAAVVAEDEREAGRRMVLNHGHTIGHGLEAAMKFELRHGEAVALGMRVENELAVRRGLLTRAEADRIGAILSQLRLPERLASSLEHAALMSFIRQDKKNRSGRVRFVLLKGIGSTILVDDVADSEIKEALRIISPREHA